jgi:hypothetical protein
MKTDRSFSNTGAATRLEHALQPVAGSTACALRIAGARDAVASVLAVAQSHPELVSKIVEVLGHDVE